MRENFDFGKPFSFVFEDPEWLQKILLGGVFALASVVLVGIFFLYGYVARLVRNVIDGVQYPLPSWDDLGEYFNEGLRLFAVGLVYAVPTIALVLAAMIPTIVMSAVDNDVANTMGGLVVSCVWCLMVPVSLALAVWIPGAMLMAVVDKRFSAAFEFERIWTFIKANAGNYALAYVAWLIARFIAPFGMVLFCIGIVFTIFWSLLVGAYAFAQTYRLSTVK